MYPYFPNGLPNNTRVLFLGLIGSRYGSLCPPYKLQLQLRDRYCCQICPQWTAATFKVVVGKMLVSLIIAAAS